MKKAWRKYCKMLKSEMNMIIDDSIDSNSITKDSVYNMHILTNTIKDIYKISHMIEEEETNKDDVLKIFENMACIYKEWKKIKEKDDGDSTKSFEKIKHLMDLYDEFIEMVSKMDMTEEELTLIKNHIKSL